jgi:hypothetical protein
MLKLLTEPQFGDGNIWEASPVGTCLEDTVVEEREVPIELLYPKVVGNHLIPEDQKFQELLRTKGMRGWLDAM